MLKAFGFNERPLHKKPCGGRFLFIASVHSNERIGTCVRGGAFFCNKEHLVRAKYNASRLGARFFIPIESVW